MEETQHATLLFVVAMTQFLEDNILKPLHMKDTGYDSNSAIIMHRASGYSLGEHGDVENAPFISMTIPFSAGGLYSTTEDLVRWEQGLFGGKVLSAASLRKMTTPFKANYAFGLWVSTLNGHRLIEHSGGINGFSTEMAYYPDDKIIVIVLENIESGAPQGIARLLAMLAHGEKVVLPSERREVTVAPAVLASYVGTYEIYPGYDAVITLEDGHLIEQTAGGPKYQLVAESDANFFIKGRDSEIAFFRNGKGEVTHLVFQAQMDMKATKK